MQVRADNVTEETGQTDCQHTVSPASYLFNAGTWAGALGNLAASVPSIVRTAAAATFTAIIPLNPPSRVAGSRGAKIMSIEHPYKITTAALNGAPEPTVYKVSNAATPVAAAGGGTITMDALNDTAAKRLATGSRRMKVTLGTPAFIADGETWFMHLPVWDAAAGSVVDLGAATVNYTRAL